MKVGDLMRDLIKLVSPPGPRPAALAPARVKPQPAQDWIAQNRCW
jgi:hypothetical protein